MSRILLTGHDLRQVQELIDEGVVKLVENFEDERYSMFDKRKITIDIVFEPEENEPKQLKVLIGMKVTVPKRLAKVALAVVKNGDMFLDQPEEDTPLFDDPARDLAQRIKDARGKVSVVQGGGGEE